MRRNLGNPDAEKVLQDRPIAFFQQDRPRFLIAHPGWLLITGYKPGLWVPRPESGVVKGCCMLACQRIPYPPSIFRASLRVSRLLLQGG